MNTVNILSNKHNTLSTPILLIVFNRLNTAQSVLNQIRLVKPRKLYIASDGARRSRDGEDANIKNIRKYILESIDWDCKVETLFQDNNLGCKVGVSTAIDWFFNNEESGIILEDDVIPSVSFFYYCEELLEKYKNEESIGMISGSNYFFEERVSDDDYYFSMFPFIWGWATWRRVWDKYDSSMKDLDKKRLLKIIRNIFTTKECINYYYDSIIATYNNKINTWDYQLAYLMFCNAYYNICPTKNMISNIGFGSDATHTKHDSIHNNMQRYEINFPIRHPQKINRGLGADINFENRAFKKNIFKSILKRLLLKI